MTSAWPLAETISHQTLAASSMSGRSPTAPSRRIRKSLAANSSSVQARRAKPPCARRPILPGSAGSVSTRSISDSSGAPCTSLAAKSVPPSVLATSDQRRIASHERSWYIGGMSGGRSMPDTAQQAHWRHAGWTSRLGWTLAPPSVLGRPSPHAKGEPRPLHDAVAPRHRSPRRTGPPPEVGRQLTEYVAGACTDFDLVLGLYGTAYQIAVGRSLLTIPVGETRTYGDIAQSIGRPRAARAAGQALGENPLPVRVVGEAIRGVAQLAVLALGGVDVQGMPTPWTSAHSSMRESGLSSGSRRTPRCAPTRV